MEKRRYFILFSVLTNVILIIILVYKLRSPVINQLSDRQDRLVSQDVSGGISPAVIGESKEVQEDLVRVTKVIDGDTIGLETGEVVRYIGIDTPEISRGATCFAKESTDKNKELVLGKEVRLEKDVSEKDRYGRLLRYVYVGEIFVNEYLIKEGYATVSTYPPDVKYSQVFKDAESNARENKRGLWGECGDSLSTSPSLSKDISSESSGTSANLNLDLNCSTNTYNCSDFKIQAEAQAAFEACGGTSNDIHKLDRDSDGKVCETLP